MIQDMSDGSRAFFAAMARAMLSITAIAVACVVVCIRRDIDVSYFVAANGVVGARVTEIVLRWFGRQKQDAAISTQALADTVGGSAIAMAAIIATGIVLSVRKDLGVPTLVAFGATLGPRAIGLLTHAAAAVKSGAAGLGSGTGAGGGGGLST